MYKYFVLIVVSILFTYPAQAAEDALDEVNQFRTRLGLHPFVRDESLSRAAAACADFRAKRLIDGHTSSDFEFLPEGSSADAAGCAAWPPELGWGSCCSRENWRYGGAAWAMGRDGQRYMHLFVRNSPPPEPIYRWKRAKSFAGWVYYKGISRWALCEMGKNSTRCERMARVQRASLKK